MPYQVALLLNTLGDDALKVYNGFVFTTTEDKRTTAEVIAKIDEFAIGEINETFERFKFNKRSQREGETFESFLTSIRTLVKTCNYCNTCVDSILRDRILLGVQDPTTQQLLLKERKLTLNKCIDICKAAEDAVIQGHAFRDNTESVVNRMSVKSQSDHSKRPYYKTCLFCAKQHEFKKELCPAYGKTCTACKGQNHFASSARCQSKVNFVTCEHTESGTSETAGQNDSNDNLPTGFWLGCLRDDVKSGNKRIYAKMLVGDTHVDFQLDSGAETNTICESYVPKHTLVKPTSRKLLTWNGGKVSPVGEATIDVVNPKTGKTHSVYFVVVPDTLSCLFGLETVQALHLMSVNKDVFNISSVSEQQLESKYPSVFDGTLGKLPGSVTLRLCENSVPKQLPARNIPYAIKDEVKSEIDRLVKFGVLTPVNEPTEWVSQMAVARKKSGAIRICVDPAPLNTALRREHYKLPTLDDVLDKFSEARVFSKFDVENAYWHLELDETSSLLTTMITPWGRFRWLRLPFGLSVSGEIFQRRLTEALSGLDGVAPIADDIAVVGKDDSNHDVQLDSLLKCCEEHGIRLNRRPDKRKIKCKEMAFHGHVFTTDGLKPDASKIEALRDMPAPTDVSGVLRFCGIAQYLTRFLPHLSDIAAPLRELTRKGAKWKWSESQESAFTAIKQMACESPLLAHYNPAADLTLQTDASSHGLGAVMLQNGVPVAYASRALNPTEQNYAQIEKECLSVVFGLEKFDQYTYGREVVVENDHKPLEILVKKSLSATPKRLQAMRMRINRYAIKLFYKPGPSMVLPDTLSRAYPNLSGDSGHTGPFDTVNSLAFMPVSDKRVDEIRAATAADDSMQKLIATILEGWPESKDKVPSELASYYAVRDTLSVQDGVILKGERLVIPVSMRPDVRQKLHAAHLGRDSMLRRARELVYWPGMNNEIQQLAESCDICQSQSPRQCQEPMIPHSRGDIPWQKVGADLFSIQGRHYLVTVDYLSNFWEIDFMTSLTTSAIIMKMKQHFARYGIPQILVSDNAQFASAEFRAFTNDYNIQHDTSSPGHSRSNGKAESAVKAAKKLVKKCAEEGSDPYKAMLELRNTPMQGVNLSPAQILMQRKTRSDIPTTQKLLRPRIAEPHAALQQKVDTQKRQYDKHAQPLSQLPIGQAVIYDRFDSLGRRAVWKRGIITGHHHAPRSYEVKGNDGAELRRNRVHIKPVPPDEPGGQYDNVVQSDKPILTCEGADQATTQAEPVSQHLDRTPLGSPDHSVSHSPTSFSSRPPRTVTKPAYLNDYVCD